MAEARRGMGRGLAAILAVSTDAADGVELRELPVDRIVANPHQPRRHFDEAALVALADSVRERGVLQPVLVSSRVDGTYELIAGERRWRAAVMAELGTVPALVRERGDAASLELALIENMAREDLSPVEEARACAGLVEELGLTRAEVGLRVGRSRVAVTNLLRLLDLPEETLRALDRGELSEGHGRALLLAEEHSDRRRLGRLAAQERWSVRVLEDRARGSNARVAKTPSAAAATGADPDREMAESAVAEVLGEALGHEVRARAGRGGQLRVELSFSSPQEALDLARRLRPPTVA